MNILTELRAALDTWGAAEAAYYDYDRSDVAEIARRLDDKMRARSVLFSKLFRYAPALLDVAEAADELCHGGTFPRLQAVLAPLVKEV